MVSRREPAPTLRHAERRCVPTVLAIWLAFRIRAYGAFRNDCAPNG